MSEELRTTKEAIRDHQRRMREAISAGEWHRASTEAHELSERLADLAGLEEQG